MEVETLSPADEQKLRALYDALKQLTDSVKSLLEDLEPPPRDTRGSGPTELNVAASVNLQTSASAHMSVVKVIPLALNDQANIMVSGTASASVVPGWVVRKARELGDDSFEDRYLEAIESVLLPSELSPRRNIRHSVDLHKKVIDWLNFLIALSTLVLARIPNPQLTEIHATQLVQVQQTDTLIERVDALIEFTGDVCKIANSTKQEVEAIHQSLGDLGEASDEPDGSDELNSDQQN